MSDLFKWYLQKFECLINNKHESSEPVNNCFTKKFCGHGNIFTSISQKQSNRLDRKYAYKWFYDLWGVCLNGSRSQIKFKNHCIVTKIKVLHYWGLHYSKLNVKRLKNESSGRNCPYFFCITNFFSFWYKFTHIVNGSCSFSFETSQ